MSGKKQNKLASLFTSTKEPPAVIQQPQSISQTPQDYYSTQPALTQRHPSTSSTTDTVQYQYDSEISQEDLDQAISTLENVLKSMDAVRETSLRQTIALRAHAESLREYAVGVNMRSSPNSEGSEKGNGRQGKERPNVGEDKVFEKILVHAAGFYDRLAESQEKLGKFYLQEYNTLNSLSSQHFRALATASGETTQTLRSLSSKISKLTVVPGTANTENASRPGVVGVHENYVQKLGIISKEMKKVRSMHLKEWGGKTKGMDRRIGRGELNICKELYSSLADSIARCGAADGMQGLNTWGAFVVNDVSPPIREPDLGLRREKDVPMPTTHRSDVEEPPNHANNDAHSNQNPAGLWPIQQRSRSVHNTNPSYETGQHSFETGQHSYETGQHSYETGQRSYETGQHSYEPNPVPYMMESLSGVDDYVENVNQGSKNTITAPRPPSDYSHFSSLINEARDEPSSARINIQMMGSSIAGSRSTRQVSKVGGNYTEPISGGLYPQQMPQPAPPIPSQTLYDQEAQVGRRDLGARGVGYGYAEDSLGSNPNLQQVRIPPTPRPTASSSVLQGAVPQGAATGIHSPIVIVGQDIDRMPLPPATANRESMNELNLLRDGLRRLEDNLKRGSKTSYGGIGVGSYLSGHHPGISNTTMTAQRAVSEPLIREENQARNFKDFKQQPVKRVNEITAKSADIERNLKAEMDPISLNATLVTSSQRATPSGVVADASIGSYFPPQKSPRMSSYAGDINVGDGSQSKCLNAMEQNMPFSGSTISKNPLNNSTDTDSWSENRHLYGQPPNLPPPQSINDEQNAYITSLNPSPNFAAPPSFSPPALPAFSASPELQRNNQGQAVILPSSISPHVRLSTPNVRNSTDHIPSHPSTSQGKGIFSPSPSDHKPLLPRTNTQNVPTPPSDVLDRRRSLADAFARYPDLSSSSQLNIGSRSAGEYGMYAPEYITHPDKQSLVAGERHGIPTLFQERSSSAQLTQQSTQKDAAPHSSLYGHEPSLSMQFFGSKSPSPPMTTQSTVTELQGHGYVTSRTPQYSSRKPVFDAYTKSEIGILGDEHSDFGFVDQNEEKEASIYEDARERQSRNNSGGNQEDCLPESKKQRALDNGAK